MASPIPPNEAQRIEALHSYDILDTKPEAGYDDLTELAAEIFGCPIAFIGFIDETREWMKFKRGLPAEVTEVPREITVCSTTICMNNIFIGPDLSKDERFADLPYVAGDPHLRFYCGMALINPDGYAVGTLCVLDFESREMEFRRQEALRRLSRQVVTQLELRRSLAKQRVALSELESARQAVEEERAKSDRLLLNILPAKIADELKEHQRVTPHFFDTGERAVHRFPGFYLAHRAHGAEGPPSTCWTNISRPSTRSSRDTNWKSSRPSGTPTCASAGCPRRDRDTPSMPVSPAWRC